MDLENNPPVIDVNSVKVKKQNLKPGDERVLQASATDDESGVGSVNLVYQIPKTLVHDEAITSVHIELSDYDEDGVWTELMREWMSTSSAITEDTPEDFISYSGLRHMIII